MIVAADLAATVVQTANVPPITDVAQIVNVEETPKRQRYAIVVLTVNVAEILNVEMLANAYHPKYYQIRPKN